MTQKLQDFVGKEVDVWSIRGETEIKDSGRLHDVTEQFVVIEQYSSLLFFPLARVRLIKPRP